MIAFRARLCVAVEMMDQSQTRFLPKRKKERETEILLSVQADFLVKSKRPRPSFTAHLRARTRAEHNIKPVLQRRAQRQLSCPVPGGRLREREREQPKSGSGHGEGRESRFSASASRLVLLCGLVRSSGLLRAASRTAAKRIVGQPPNADGERIRQGRPAGNGIPFFLPLWISFTPCPHPDENNWARRGVSPRSRHSIIEERSDSILAKRIDAQIPSENCYLSLLRPNNRRYSFSCRPWTLTETA